MVQGNLNFIAKRLLGRPTCVLGPGAKLGWQSRILNARDSSEFIKIGACSVVLGELFVFAHGGAIEIGVDSYIDAEARIWSAASIKIGNGVVIGPGVNVFDSLTHPIISSERHAQVRAIFSTGHPKEINLSESAVVIEDGVEIGARSIILRGVTIAKGTLVAPGSVVTKSIPSESKQPVP